MNKQKGKNQHLKRLHHTSRELISSMSEQLFSWFPDQFHEYIVICIGTDRSTGDALGPLTGTFLTEQKLNHLVVYGTVHEPVHATNLESYIDHITHTHNNPYIIAVDACLGQKLSVGQITVQTGPVKPGAALNKVLPAIGDVHLTGIVNVGGFMEYSVLQSTRLATVIDMAKQIANILKNIDQRLSIQRQTATIPLQKHAFASPSFIKQNNPL